MNTTASNVKALRDRAELDEAIELLSHVLAADPAATAPPGHVRDRLLGRVADSAARHQGMVTMRPRRMVAEALARGVSVRWLYRADGARVRRCGEPLRLALIELEPGARLTSGLGLAGRHSEWLVVAGSATVDGLALDTHDHHGQPAGDDEPTLASAGGAVLYLRDNGEQPTPAGTSRARQAQWESFAPGIQRRVLWRAGDACAYIARAQLGAAVPPHGHGHDEECLMLEGELFAGDVLLCQGELQLAPAGLHHGMVQAASDCLVYLRGDSELDLLPA
jgi:anti-sigma factor ChrR (cupin superfamily)